MQLSKSRILYSPKLTHSRINLLTNISSRGSATCLHITYAHVQTFICLFPLPANICGVCLVSEKDIENLKQTTAGCSNSSITPYEAVASLHDHFDDSAMAENDTEIKQRHDDYDGAEHSGEGSSNDVPYTMTIEGLGDIMSPGLEVKKCGEGLAFKHVSKDHKQIPTSYSITPYEDVLHHRNELTSNNLKHHV